MIELVGLSKSFGAVRANENIDLKVRTGTIHGIVGENGAGKSTAMKMLYGLYEPDTGDIVVNGEKRRWKSPADAVAAGIGMVHQHFMLADSETVLDNIVLGAKRLSRKAAARKLEALSAAYGLEIPLEKKVSEISVGIQQRVEILKLLYRDCETLILDEPTAVLTPQETEKLFVQLRRLRTEGKTILIITHKLKEVLALTDEVTVFRGGQVAGHRATANTSIEDLASLMVGRAVNLNSKAAVGRVREQAALKIHGFTGRGGLHIENLVIRSGEILGVAGVEGNGQSELLASLIRPDRSCAGSVEILGTEILKDGKPASTARIRALGVGLLPENRIREGLLSESPAWENFILGRHRETAFQKRGWIKRAVSRASCLLAMKNYDVRPVDTELNAGRFSGGNQQKLVVARELSSSPKFLIAAHPTRGVDIGAAEFIHAEIVKSRDSGAGVLLVSSELDELIRLSDRLIVLYRGRVVAEFSKDNLDEKRIGLAMAGGVEGTIA